MCDARPELCGSSRPKHGGVRRSRFPMLQIVDPQLLAWQTPLSTHVHTFFVRRGPPEIIEITARDHCPTARRSSPHSPLLSSAPQLASPHSPRPACRSSSSALVVSPSLSLALSCMSVSPSRGSRRLSLPLALVGSRRPSLSLSRPHASPGCPAAPRQLCCPLMRVSAGAGRSSGSGT